MLQTLINLFDTYLMKECPNYLKLILFLTYLDLVAVQENYILHYSIHLLLYRIMDHLLGTEIDKKKYVINLK